MIHKVYEPQIRARLGTAAHLCVVFVLKLRTDPRLHAGSACGFKVSGLSLGFVVYGSGIRVCSGQGSSTRSWGEGLGWCRVLGVGFRVQGFGCRVQGSGFRVWGVGFRVQGLGCRVPGSGYSVWGVGFRVWGVGFRVQGSGIGV